MEIFKRFFKRRISAEDVYYNCLVLLHAQGERRKHDNHIVDCVIDAVRIQGFGRVVRDDMNVTIEYAGTPVFEYDAEGKTGIVIYPPGPPMRMWKYPLSGRVTRFNRGDWCGVLDEYASAAKAEMTREYQAKFSDIE